MSRRLIREEGLLCGKHSAATAVCPLHKLSEPHPLGTKTPQRRCPLHFRVCWVSRAERLSLGLCRGHCRLQRCFPQSGLGSDSPATVIIEGIILSLLEHFCSGTGSSGSVELQGLRGGLVGLRAGQVGSASSSVRPCSVSLPHQRCQLWTSKA